MMLMKIIMTMAMMKIMTMINENGDMVMMMMMVITTLGIMMTMIKMDD